MDCGLGGPGKRYAERLERLLDTYPNPETGKRWRGKELEDATNGFVSGSYVTALRKGRINRPGLDKLRAIAGAMNFPFELWLTEHEKWERELEGEREDGGGFARLLEVLFEAVGNEDTGEPFTNKEVSLRSEGRLSEDEIGQMRSGELENPTRAQLLALSDVFDVAPSYWFKPGERRPLLDPETYEALKNQKTYALLHKSLGLSEDQKDMMMILMEQLRGSETKSGGGDEAKTPG